MWTGGCQSNHRGRASAVKLHFFAGFRSVLFRSELRNWLFRGTRNVSEWALSSAEQRKSFRVYSAEFFRNEIPFPTLLMTFRKWIRKNKFSKNDFHTLQGTMSHRPLTNTSSLKITAAYCLTWFEVIDELSLSNLVWGCWWSSFV